MARPDRRGPRVVEVELDLPRLAFGACLVLIAVVAAFFAGRAVGRSGAGPAGAFTPARVGDAVPAGDVEDVGARGGLFDRVGEGGTERDPGRQVTGEARLAGSIELDLGAAATREDAESLRRAAERAGVSASIAGAPGGGYRVAAGPFADADEARRAARRLSQVLGRPVTVPDSPR